MKKLSKRKMYHKRRKKEKLEQRKKLTNLIPHGTNCATFYKYSNENNSKKQLVQNNINKNYQQQNFTIPITSYSRSLQSWWQTYCSAIEFHTKQQNTGHVVSQNTQLALLNKYANDYETSSEEDEKNENSDYNETCKNDECVDEEYMKFLEITHKHQEELRLKRAKDSS